MELDLLAASSQCQRNLQQMSVLCSHVMCV